MEIGVLLGLMCKYSCEECQFNVYGSNGMRSVELEKGTILNNMRSVLSLVSVRSGFVDLKIRRGWMLRFFDRDYKFPTEFPQTVANFQRTKLWVLRLSKKVS